ncbi:MAG: hypothetical protein ACD_2C00088G0007 [uncultured bacterium (gcode 4)]|uniref:Uncharacterized protein n=1 Tax=uncultured bacterium (gcode 4) TaxID=1234023 RepID=K2G6A2_9BACT|nr:MAG: hypothetical protein ACD_2C00088G0007 [uncultured bacterium (gcode 4)]
MAKFFLHWWNSSSETDENTRFYNSLYQSAIANRSRILVLPFAQKNDKWHCKDKMLTDKLASFWVPFDGLKIDIPENNKLSILCSVIRNNVIYVPWWDFCSLMDCVSFLRHFKFLFRWKQIYGISAWASIFCKYSYSSDYAQVFEGLWFLDKLCKIHYLPQRDELCIKKLEKFGNLNNLLKIKEKEFVVLNI